MSISRKSIWLEIFVSWVSYNLLFCKKHPQLTSISTHPCLSHVTALAIKGVYVINNSWYGYTFDPVCSGILNKIFHGLLLRNRRSKRDTMFCEKSEVRIKFPTCSTTKIEFHEEFLTNVANHPECRTYQKYFFFQPWFRAPENKPTLKIRSSEWFTTSVKNE